MIFLLGGNGFIGSGFARLFARLGLEHRVIARANYQEFVGASCDVLINANGNSSKLLAKKDPLADFAANVTATRALLADVACKTYIHLSSCEVYPDCSSPAFTREDAILDPAAQSHYGFHKYLSEWCARSHAPEWLVVRQGGFVGPGLRKNAVYDILYGDNMWLHPDSALQFIHTDDSAEIIWRLYINGVRNDVVNLCGDGTVTLAEVMGWAGRSPALAPGAMTVRYEVNLDKARRICSIPDSGESVKRFVRSVVTERDA